METLIRQDELVQDLPLRPGTRSRSGSGIWMQPRPRSGEAQLPHGEAATRATPLRDSSLPLEDRLSSLAVRDARKQQANMSLITRADS